MLKEEKSSVILVFNNEGRLALQLRSATDDSYPSHWDFSAAGGIDEGEENEEAAKRELEEEISIKSDLIYLGEEYYKDEKNQEKLFIYKTIYNGDFNVNPKEVEKVELFSLNEIEKMLDSREKFHPEFLFIWNKGYMSK